MSDEENNILDLINPEEHFFNEGDILQDDVRGIRMVILETDRSDSVWYKANLELDVLADVPGDVAFSEEIEIEQEELLGVFSSNLVDLKLRSIDIQIDSLKEKRKIWEAYVEQ